MENGSGPGESPESPSRQLIGADVGPYHIVEKLGFKFDRLVQYPYGETTLELMSWVFKAAN